MVVDGRGTGPEEIGAASAAKTTRGLPASCLAASCLAASCLAPSNMMPSHPTGTVARVPAPDPLLADLDPHQRAAVTDPHVPLAILAPAGSGKTRVLTRRIAFRVREGLAEGRHVLAVTFTRRAAGELVDRLDALGVDSAVTAGTFHSLALAQLRSRAADRRQEPPRVLDRKGRILGPLLGSKRSNGASTALAVTDVAGEIEWAKARMITPDRYADAARATERRVPRPAGDLAALYARYEAEKRRRHLLDFDDLLGWCADAIERDADFAASQRWRFRHLFVDEFQDATPLQTRLLRAWLGDRPDLCVVGDGAQAIYAFAGADASPLARVLAALPGRPDGDARVQLPVDRRDRRDRGSRARAGIGRRTRRPTRGSTCGPAGSDRGVRRRRARSDDDRGCLLARVHRRRALAPHGRAVPHECAVGPVRVRAGACAVCRSG